MRAVIQRVSSAEVRVAGEAVAAIGEGLLAFVGVGRDDDNDDAEALAKKMVSLRIFADDEGRMNRSLAETGGQLIVVSQFTLFADVRKGRRPFFGAAADPEFAEPLLERVVSAARAHGVEVAAGRMASQGLHQ